MNNRRWICAAVALMTASALTAGETPSKTTPAKGEVKAAAPQQGDTPFKAFTGKVTRNKVRIRLQPSLDAPILRELDRDDMVIVAGETEDFYVVQPPADIKGYVYRTYIIDNTVEGARVNVRLEPSLESPVVAQLNTGDRIEGKISPLNSKWMEISLPANSQFFICKDYVEMVGDAQLMSKQKLRREEVNKLLNEGYMASREQLSLPYEKIDLEGVINVYQRVMNDYSDFPEQSARAKELMTAVRDEYMRKKIAFLEDQTQRRTDQWSEKNQHLKNVVTRQQQKLQQLEDQINHSWTRTGQNEQTQNAARPNSVTSNPKLAAWQAAEEKFYQEWLLSHPQKTMEDFYAEQSNDALVLRGQIEPYTRNLKKKPGDYTLLNKQNMPIAFLYSTEVELQNYVGKEVTLRVAPRPNNQFAFPAYYVLDLSTEQ